MKFFSFVPYNIFKLLFCLNVFGVIAAELPSDIKKCHFGDVECITESIKYVMRQYAKGNTAMGLIPISAVELFNITIAKADTRSPVQLNLFFQHIIANGLELANIDRVVGFEKDISNSKFEVYATVPSFRLHGEYEASGKILLLPLAGGGDAAIELIDTKFAIRLKIKEEIRNDKRYAKISKVKVAMDPKKITFDMDNMFKGNKEMSTAINDLMNENWSDIWNEVQSGVHTLIAGLIQALMAEILQKHSYDELFLED